MFRKLLYLNNGTLHMIYQQLYLGLQDGLQDGLTARDIPDLRKAAHLPDLPQHSPPTPPTPDILPTDKTIDRSVGYKVTDGSYNLFDIIGDVVLQALKIVFLSGNDLFRWLFPCFGIKSVMNYIVLRIKFLAQMFNVDTLPVLYEQKEGSTCMEFQLDR
ncbi:hypothetical protein MAR_031105 [Mya arenaria]|uniref:Uncharacterized protein n=1 Tax=Mya arenaria TaxID=6604 RepID=A0ABY7FB16_MYAAR|nr:hypothetical protein MAR_031105 [Mya arenaria]